MKKEQHVCPTCGAVKNDRYVSIFKELIDVCEIIYHYCVEVGRHEFTTREVKAFLEAGGTSVTARFGDMVMFGGIFYKTGRGKWGINMARAERFFSGKTMIPTSILIRHDGSKIKFNMKRIHQIKRIRALLNENLEYVGHKK